MALTYDIKTDVRYQQGREEKREETVIALLKSGLLTDEQIADATDSSLTQVQRIKRSLTSKD